MQSVKGVHEGVHEDIWGGGGGDNRVIRGREREGAREGGSERGREREREGAREGAREGGGEGYESRCLHVMLEIG